MCMVYPSVESWEEGREVASEIGREYLECDRVLFEAIERDIEEGSYSWEIVTLGEWSEGMFLNFSLSGGRELSVNVSELAMLFAVHDVWSVDELVGCRVPVIITGKRHPYLAVEAASDSNEWLVFVYNEWQHNVSEFE